MPDSIIISVTEVRQTLFGLVDQVEGLHKQVLLYHAMAGRRSDLLDELGNLFDELRPIIEQAAPGWWETRDPSAKIEGELDGWLPARVASAKHAAGRIHRGPISADQREDLKRRTTEAGFMQGQEPGSTMTVTIQVAQDNLPDLIHALKPGEELVITENNQPVAVLVALPRA